MKENKKIEAITIQDNEPFLRQISSSVDIKNDKELMNDIDILDQFCKENNVMAMASVQLGIPKRIVYLKNTNLDIINKIQNNSNSEEIENYNEKKVLINPTILKREGLTEYWEACASCLDNMGRVLRPYKIELEYYDIDGNQKVETFEGFESTVLSHELDHLDGILHIDIAEEVIEMPANERKKWRQSHEYKIYQKDGDYDSLRDKGKKKVLR
jgi:peptide deformylase